MRFASFLLSSLQQNPVSSEFRAEATRIQADLAPSTGEDVQERVKRIYATPRPVIDRVKKLLAP